MPRLPRAGGSLEHLARTSLPDRFVPVSVGHVTGRRHLLIAEEQWRRTHRPATPDLMRSIASGSHQSSDRQTMENYRDLRDVLCDPRSQNTHSRRRVPSPCIPPGSRKRCGVAPRTCGKSFSRSFVNWTLIRRGARVLPNTGRVCLDLRILPAPEIGMAAKPYSARTL